jgi:hypothetical protein
MRRRPGRLLAAALTISSAMSVTPPAQAAMMRFEDRRGDAGGRMDIEWVSVDNGRPLTIIIKHRNLTRSTAEAGAFIDVEPGAGPEYLVNGGVYDSDYQLSRANGWRPGNEPLNCPVVMSPNFRRDTVTYQISRRCLDTGTGAATSVRVAAIARVPGLRTDWAPGYRRWSSWVRHTP